MADEQLSPDQQILRDYPTLAYLLNDPEIGPLLRDAIDPNKGYDAATFQAKVMQTGWWRTHTDKERAWETLANTDPAEADAQRQRWINTFQTEATRAGVNLTADQLTWYAAFYVPKGIAATDPAVLEQFSTLYQTKPEQRTGTGTIDTIKDQMHQITNSYFRDLGAQDYDWWAANIASGAQTIDNFKTVIQNQARDRFPSYFKEINAGITPEQLFGQQRDAIARELEVDPTTIDLAHDPRWSKVLGVAGADGTQRPMTYNEAIQLARAQPEWQKTSAAQTQAADLSMTILKTFGKVA